MRVEGAKKEKWVSLLRGVKFFRNLDIDDLKRLLEAGKLRHYKFHDYVVKEGEVDFSFFVILKGKVKIFKFNRIGKRKEIGIFLSGECFGEMGLLLKEARSASALAAEECFIFKLNAEQIESMPESTQVKLYREFSEDLAKKLKSTTKEMVSPSL